MLIGTWKNIEDLENCLSLPELDAILTAARKREYEVYRMNAGLQGHEAPEWDSLESGSGTSFEDVKRRAEAKLRGISEEQAILGDIGVQVIEE
jgi:hypothetical protein